MFQQNLIQLYIQSPELVNFDLWWHGPEYLTSSPNYWPVQPSTCPEPTPEVSQEEHVLINQVTVKNLDIIDLLLSKFSSIMTVQRILAYILRFNPKNRILHSCTVCLTPRIAFEQRFTSRHTKDA